MQGTPLQNSIQNDAPTREAALFGAHGAHINLTDGHYVYMRAPISASNEPLFEYTLMPTHMRNPFSVEELQDIDLADPFSFTKGCKTIKIPVQPQNPSFEQGTRLYDLQNDPKQEHPVVDSKVETRLMKQMVKMMKWNDSPAEQFKRIGLDD
jgi:hypothetical protein